MTRRSTAEVYNEVQRLEASIEQMQRYIEERLNQLAGRLDQITIMLFNEQRGWLPQLQTDIRDLPNVLRRAVS